MCAIDRCNRVQVGHTQCSFMEIRSASFRVGESRVWRSERGNVKRQRGTKNALGDTGEIIARARGWKKVSREKERERAGNGRMVHVAIDRDNREIPWIKPHEEENTGKSRNG